MLRRHAGSRIDPHRSMRLARMRGGQPQPAPLASIPGSRKKDNELAPFQRRLFRLVLPLDAPLLLAILCSARPLPARSSTPMAKIHRPLPPMEARMDDAGGGGARPPWSTARRRSSSRGEARGGGIGRVGAEHGAELWPGRRRTSGRGGARRGGGARSRRISARRRSSGVAGAELGPGRARRRCWRELARLGDGAPAGALAARGRSAGGAWRARPGGAREGGQRRMGRGAMTVETGKRWRGRRGLGD
ncbi:hypothetical protein PAHAL_2G311200 [Panicum hallii]|uniref:Uncharacterized protein n=1 Tax=Panicum hallii TaxID=206008 RepID=A0A2T8KQZ6_9POAL|nr:hypothetical protein PAHAL_2G311200 [Panicum hallii]